MEPKLMLELSILIPPSVTKSFSPAVVPAGGTSTLTIFLNNDNPADITLSSVFIDTFPTSPDNMVLVASPDITNSTCNQGDITANNNAGEVRYANGATIPSGGCFIEVQVTAPTAGTYTNRIEVGDLETSVGTNQIPATANLDVSAKGFIFWNNIF